MSDAIAKTLHDKHLRLWGIPLSVAGLLFSQMPIFFPGRWDLLWKYVVIGVLYTSLIWEVSRWCLVQVRRRYPALEQTRERAIRILAAFVVVAGIGQLFIPVAATALKLESPLWDSPVRAGLINFSGTLFIILLIGGLYEAKYFFGQYKDALQKAERLKKQQAQHQLDTLKNRVNPHFLFNSLTTLSALIGEDAERAEQFVDELAKVYRYLLRAGRQPMSSLEEELQFAQSYIFLLKNRFEDGAIALRIRHSDGDLSSRAEWRMPALALQHTLDYLLRTQNTPLHIQIEGRDSRLWVTCRNQPKTLAFDVADNDWALLENNGTVREICDEDLLVSIPITENVQAS